MAEPPQRCWWNIGIEWLFVIPPDQIRLASGLDFHLDSYVDTERKLTA